MTPYVGTSGWDYPHWASAFSCNFDNDERGHAALNALELHEMVT